MGSGSKLVFMTLGCAVNNYRWGGGGLGWVGGERVDMVDGCRK